MISEENSSSPHHQKIRYSESHYSIQIERFEKAKSFREEMNQFHSDLLLYCLHFGISFKLFESDLKNEFIMREKENEPIFSIVTQEE